MNDRGRRHPVLQLATLIVAASLLSGTAPPPEALDLPRTPPPAVGGAAEPIAVAGPPEPGPSAAPLIAFPELLDAAAALRRRDCSGAIAALETVAGGVGPAASLAGLAQGLYAHACQQIELAETKLFASAHTGGALEDWRLLILSDTAEARGHRPVAEAALVRLIENHPDSPLLPRALQRAAELAREGGDARRALELVDTGRRLGLSGESAARLEELAWQIGGEIGDREVRATAARRLLVEAPFEASRLKVVDGLRGADGRLDWPAVLTRDELIERAESFLALDDPTAALATLAEVPAAARDAGWRRIQARALTAAHRGLEALSVLDGVAAGSPTETAELEWERAAAALDAATARRGQANLASAERDKLRRLAEAHLWAAAAHGADPELAARALGRLFVELSDSGRFDEVVDVLERLRRLDPGDETGARYLWELGWDQYRLRNSTGAVGYWSELASIYPDSRYARSGRYWTARAFEQLGQPERARQIFAEVAAADTTDFYRKYAVARLGGGDLGTGRAGGRDEPVEPWPYDPALIRVRMLSDLGLDDLALAELELMAPDADPRAAAALSAVVRSRRGERREAISLVRRAFPALGGPYQARLPDEALRIYYPLDYEAMIRPQAERQQLPLYLLYGMIRQPPTSTLGRNSRVWSSPMFLVWP
jgi:tetratricopeptide (TPR) repeat protein